MNKNINNIKIVIFFFVFIITSCTAGGQSDTTNNSKDNSNRDINDFSLTITKPNTKDFLNIPVNPTISFKFNKHANNINLDNIYMLDSNTEKSIVINGIKEYQDSDETIIYSISPTLSYDTEYKLVFSSAITDDNGNRLKSTYNIFHTVKNSGDDPVDTEIKISLSQPDSKVNVDITKDIIFTSSERINYSEDSLGDIIHLYRNNDTNNPLPIQITNSQNKYNIKHDTFNNNEDYCLIIADPEHKIKNQKLGIHNLCFHTALESDYAQIISQVDQLQADAPIIVYIDPSVKVDQSSFMLKDLRSPTDKIDFDYLRMGDFYIVKIKGRNHWNSKYQLIITYTSPSKQQVIDIQFADSLAAASGLNGKTDLLSYKTHCTADSCDDIILTLSIKLDGWYYESQLPGTILLYEGIPIKENLIPIDLKMGSGYTPDNFIITPKQLLNPDKQYIIVVDKKINQAVNPVNKDNYIGYNSILFTIT